MWRSQDLLTALAGNKRNSHQIKWLIKKFERKEGANWEAKNPFSKEWKQYINLKKSSQLLIFPYRS